MNNNFVENFEEIPSSNVYQNQQPEKLSGDPSSLLTRDEDTSPFLNEISEVKQLAFSNIQQNRKEVEYEPQIEEITKFDSNTNMIVIDEVEPKEGSEQASSKASSDAQNQVINFLGQVAQNEENQVESYPMKLPFMESLNENEDEEIREPNTIQECGPEEIKQTVSQVQEETQDFGQIQEIGQIQEVEELQQNSEPHSPKIIEELKIAPLTQQLISIEMEGSFIEFEMPEETNDVWDDFEQMTQNEQEQSDQIISRDVSQHLHQSQSQIYPEEKINSSHSEQLQKFEAEVGQEEESQNQNYMNNSSDGNKSNKESYSEEDRVTEEACQEHRIDSTPMKHPSKQDSNFEIQNEQNYQEDHENIGSSLIQAQQESDFIIEERDTTQRSVPHQSQEKLIIKSENENLSMIEDPEEHFDSPRRNLREGSAVVQSFDDVISSNGDQEDQIIQNNQLSMDQVQSGHNSTDNSVIGERKELQDMLAFGIGVENEFERSRPITQLDADQFIDTLAPRRGIQRQN